MGLKDVTNVQNDNSSKGSNKRTYVQPDVSDFDEFFNNRDEEWKIVDVPSGEYVAETQSFLPDNENVVIRCYTTLDKHTGKARGKGKDAIRLIVWDKTVNRPVAGREKTLRIKTWRKNLGDKIDYLMQQGEALVTRCPECESRMVLREGKYGKFFGCTNYPDCTGTREYNE